jgi:hypothetical protein
MLKAEVTEGATGMYKNFGKSIDFRCLVAREFEQI